jgi:hypothetical protein
MKQLLLGILIATQAIVSARATQPQTPQEALLVGATNVNTAQSSASVELTNTTNKVITGYVLHIQQFDAGHNALPVVNIGRDALYYDANWRKNERNDAEVIQPRAAHVWIGGVTAGTVSAEVTVTGVVFGDRSRLGSDADIILTQRAQTAQHLNQAAKFFDTYPANPGAFRDAVQQARVIDAGTVDQLLAQELHIPDAVAVAYLTPLPVDIPMPDAKAWRDIGDDLREEAAFWSTQSQEAKQ